MFVPLLYELLLKSLTQSLGFLQIFWFHPLILNQFDTRFKCELGTSIRILHMNVDR